MRLRPRDPEIDRAYRDVCAQLAPSPPHRPIDPDSPARDPRPRAHPAPARGSALRSPAGPATQTLPPDANDDADDSRAAARVEELTHTLQGDPTRDDVVDELAALLVRLGRSLELLALLSARLEDAPPERRAQLLPAQRAVLTRLEEDARAAGRESEASLFRDARQMLD